MSLLKLGKVTYKQNNLLYSTTIDNNLDLVDEKHKRIFMNSLHWIDFLQKTYPSNDNRPITLTMHEFVKLSTEISKEEVFKLV